jgi:hypothetical protein
MTSNAMEFFALGSEDKVHLSDSEISDLYDEEDGDSGDGDDKEADRVRMESGEAADSSIFFTKLPNAFDRLRVSGSRSFNGVKLLN